MLEENPSRVHFVAASALGRKSPRHRKGLQISEPQSKSFEKSQKEGNSTGFQMRNCLGSLPKGLDSCLETTNAYQVLMSPAVRFFFLNIIYDRLLKLTPSFISPIFMLAFAMCRAVFLAPRMQP